MPDPSSDAAGIPDPDRLLALTLSRPLQALQVARSVLATRPPPGEAAVAHQAAGIVLRDFGDTSQALVEFRAAMRCARRAGDDTRAYDVQASYGVALIMSGRPGAGLVQLETAARHASGTAAGRIEMRRSFGLHELGRREEALRCAQRAVALLLGDDQLWEARALNMRAVAHLSLGHVDEADHDFERAEKQYSEAGQLLDFASVRHDRAMAAFARGDLPTALALLDDAQRMVDDLDVFEPDVFVTRVQVLLAAGLNRDALRVAEDGVARGEQVRIAATERGELLFTAALAASAVGDHATTAERSGEAQTMFRRQGRSRWAGRSTLLLLQSRFASSGASPSLLRAADRLAATAASIDTDLAGAAHLLAGRVALAGGRRPAALRHLRAAASRRPRDIRARMTVWLARAVLADAEGRRRDLLAACARGLDQLHALLSTFGATELRAQATWQGAELAAIALRHAVASGDAARVLSWSERWRATSLVAPTVRPGSDDETTRDLAALRTLARRLDAGDPRDPGTAAMQLERRRLEDALRRRVLSRQGSPTAPPPRTAVAELRTALGGTDFVHLTDVDGELVAVALSADRPASLWRIGPTAEADRALAQALFALRRTLAHRPGAMVDNGAIGRRLQQALLGPALAALTADSIVVVPPGRLHAVPWGLLPDVGDRDVVVSPSASAWLRCHRVPAPTTGRVVLVGGPGLSTGVSEVHHLARRYPEAVVLTGGTATSHNVLAAMDGAQLVHVAAHGTFRADSPLLSALELDDGPLTVYDLEGLARAPHRIVLSSCNSAVGAPSGAEELLGVVSALMGLGSAGVIASVVPIDDPSSVPFMIALHERLSRAPLGQALRQARAAVADDPIARATAHSFIALGA